MKSIHEVRENWYQAYKRGDTEVLRGYESSSLVVTLNGIEDRADRYFEIEKKIALNSWFQPELIRDESIDERGSVCRVSGQAEVKEGRAKGQVLTYSETWENIDSGWLLMSLQIDA